MKQLVKVEEVEAEGLLALLGKPVMLYGLTYIYAGTLSGVNDSFVKLTEAQIVYETGPFNSTGYKLAEALPGGCWYVCRATMESFGPGK